MADSHEIWYVGWEWRWASIDADAISPRVFCRFSRSYECKQLWTRDFDDKNDDFIWTDLCDPRRL